ncbi:MAG: acyl-CoA/acyl-ACP dehydrogenase [Proteobacteria bacterium]|nr:acyl-CoA/acyl-ACP dehydrogenase [Pseudomonadota bacterium]
MEFSLNEETVILRDSARRFLKERCPISTVREVLSGDAGYSSQAWRDMADLGWLGLIHDEAYGGFGGSFFDLFVLFKETGRVVLPSPFFSVVLCGLILGEAAGPDQKAAWLPPLIEGREIWTAGLLDERGGYDFEAPSLVASPAGDGGYVLNGTRLMVPYAHAADRIVVCAHVRDPASGGPTLFRADRSLEGLSLEPLDTLSLEKTWAVHFDQVRLSSESVIGGVGRGAEALAGVWPRATVLKCAQMLGGMERVVEMTVTHVKERRQFGRPLGALQAVQHLCADMATCLETSKLISQQAAWMISEGRPAIMEAAMAKAWCNEAGGKCAAIGHQLQGGIAFTEEHDMHFYSKQARAAELTWGASWLHRRAVARGMGI